MSWTLTKHQTPDLTITHKPHDYAFGEFSTFQQKLTREGYEVEAYVRQLVSTYSNSHEYDFQREFEAEHLYAKADIADHKITKLDELMPWNYIPAA